MVGVCLRGQRSDQSESNYAKSAENEMSPEEPRLVELRTSINTLSERAVATSLSEKAFLDAFPPDAAHAHREILVRIRQQLAELIASGTDAAVTTWTRDHAISEKFRKLDALALNNAAASLAMSSNIEESTENGSQDVKLLSVSHLSPYDLAARARIGAKKAEIADLESRLEKEEADAENLRVKVRTLYNQALNSSDRISALSANASDISGALKMCDERCEDPSKDKQ